MRSVHLPFDHKNPYQGVLAQHLAAFGVEVVPRRHHTWRLLDRMLFEWRAEAIHFHWLERFVRSRSPWRLPMDFLCFAVQLAVLRLLGKRIAWTVHNLKSHEDEHPWREWAIGATVGRTTHAVFVHGEYARREVVRRFGVRPEKIVVIPHGHYVDSYPNDMGRAEAKRQLDLDARKTTVLFLGNIRPYKGVERLIDDFLALQREDIELVIAGRPFSQAQEDELRELAAGQVSIHFHPGFVPDEDLQVYMNAADVVAFPYRDVLTSGAVVLAMSFGRACIAPRIGCIGEALDEEGAFFYEADDEAGLRRQLEAALAAKDRLDEMGKHNLSRALTWDWARIAELTAAAYRGERAVNPFVV